MISSCALLLAVFFTVSAAKVGYHHLVARDVDFIDYYDCKGKANGNYYHPNDCTKFITCSNGYASERDCAACHPGSQGCPNGRTHFDEPSNSCLRSGVARCTGGRAIQGQLHPPVTKVPPSKIV